MRVASRHEDSSSRPSMMTGPVARKALANRNPEGVGDDESFGALGRVLRACADGWADVADVADAAGAVGAVGA